MSISRGKQRRQIRAGWSLVEMLVVLAVLGLVAGASAAALASRQREARSAAEVRAARADLRDAAGVLARELRGIVRSDTLPLATDTAIEFFAPLRLAVTCAPAQGPRLLLVPLPAWLDSTTPIATPDTGDVAWVWREDSLLPPGRWQHARIAAFSAAISDSCDPAYSSGAALPQALVLADDPGAVGVGAPVQIVRRGRYSIYRSSDNVWYLGYRRCDATGPSRCQPVQPVAGPYRARAGGTPGIQFRYFDSSGVEVWGAAAQAGTFSVELVVRSDTAGSAGRAPRDDALDDSTVLVIAIRNAL